MYAGKIGLFVDPSHEQFYDNELFNENSRWNRDGQFAPFILFKERLTERGICVYTADYLLKNKISFDINTYISFGITNNYVNLLERRDIRLQSFYIMEPPVVAPQLYREIGNLARNFARVYLHNAEGIGYDRYFNGQQNLRKFFWPQAEDGVIVKLWENRNRGFLVMINSNKKPVLKDNELYSERIRALVQFQKLGPVDLYGHGWDAPFYRLRQARYIPFLYWKHRNVLRAIYKGSVQSKYEVLSRYHFALCFENMVMPGYITEKIFDCFFVGTVPVYLGAPDIDKYIPRNCFIDQRDFADYGQLCSFLQSLTEKDISSFRDAAREYLTSSQYRPFTKLGFVEQFEDDLWEILKGI